MGWEPSSLLGLEAVLLSSILGSCRGPAWLSTVPKYYHYEPWRYIGPKTRVKDGLRSPNFWMVVVHLGYFRDPVSP